jgi:hypothetical protein
LLRQITASLIAASLILTPALGVSAFAQTAAPAGAQEQPAQAMTPAPKPMKKKPSGQKMVQKMAKPTKPAPKAKAPPATDQGQQPSDQE